VSEGGSTQGKEIGGRKRTMEGKETREGDSREERRQEEGR